MITSVWSAYDHVFMDDGGDELDNGTRTESCLTCGAMFYLVPNPDDPTSGTYQASNGDDPVYCTRDTSMNHGYDDPATGCNCVACR